MALRFAYLNGVNEMTTEQNLKALLMKMVNLSEDLLDQLINATEDFEEPVSDEEIREHEALINLARSEATK